MIISSLDIYKNKVVRLYKGNIKDITFFGYIIEYLDFYSTIKIEKIHIVSLDNIFFKKKNIFPIIKKIKIQLGGGIDNLEKIKFYLQKKIYKFILGSVVFKNKIEFKKIISFFKKKIIISLDCLNNFVTINGWIFKTNFSFNEIFLYLFDLNIKNIIYTNILKDGTLIGIKTKELNFLYNKQFICNFTISGGISSYNEINLINKNFNFNFIIGISIYKFKIKIRFLC